MQRLGRVNPGRANSRCCPSPGLHLLIPVLCLISAVCPAGASAQSVPSITQQPKSQNLLAGTNAAFTVSATGQTPLRYQWSFNGTNLSNNSHIGGATNATLVVSNIASSDAGNYRVVITNSHGSATSSNATLTVLFPPSIVTQPSNLVVTVSSNVSLMVSATGTGPLSYHWYYNGTALADNGRISGALTPNLQIANFQISDGGNYQAVVANGYGMATS